MWRDVAAQGPAALAAPCHDRDTASPTPPPGPRQPHRPLRPLGGRYSASSSRRSQKAAQGIPCREGRGAWKAGQQRSGAGRARVGRLAQTTVGASSMLHASLLGAKKMEQSGVHKLARTSWRGCAGAPRPHGTRHLPLKLLRSAAASPWSGDPHAALRGRRSWEGRGAAAVSGGVEAGVGCRRRAGRVGQGRCCLPASTGSRQGPVAGAGLELRAPGGCRHALAGRRAPDTPSPAPTGHCWRS